MNKGGRPPVDPAKRKRPLPLSISRAGIQVIDSIGARMRIAAIIEHNSKSREQLESFLTLIEAMDGYEDRD